MNPASCDPLCRRLRRARRHFLAWCGLLPMLLASHGSGTEIANAERPTLIVIVGAAGEETYGASFAAWASVLEETAKKAGARELTVGLKTNQALPPRDQLQQALAAEPKDGTAQLWLVLIGHGTFDGREAKLNLAGPDLSATDLADWLKPFRRPLAIIHTGSASAPFLGKLSASNRVVITATRSGSEVNHARFGGYFCAAIADPGADLDKDGQTSLLEAFLMAARRVKEFYDTEGRLATEHALIDDNGDGLGTPPDWFRGIRAVRAAKDGTSLDGSRAHQLHLLRSATELALTPANRARRDELEQAVEKLRQGGRAGLGDDEYYRRLEALLLELARLYEGNGKPDGK